MRLSPSSSNLPSPTATTRPFCGFSLAVSGSTRPLAVVSSSSIARTIKRSPRGLSFILEYLHLGTRLGGSTGPSASQLGPDRPFGTLTPRVPTTPSIYRRSGAFQGRLALLQHDCRHLRAPVRAPSASSA